MHPESCRICTCHAAAAYKLQTEIGTQVPWAIDVVVGCALDGHVPSQTDTQSHAASYRAIYALYASVAPYGTSGTIALVSGMHVLEADQEQYHNGTRV